VQREVAAIPGVASALSTASSSTTMRAMLGVISRLFLVLQAVIAVLAFLVAFNTSNIDADERAREHATMFAFGIPIRRVVGIGVVQSLVLGVVGVGLGLGFGAAVLRWMLNTVFPVAVPDLTVLQSIAPSSFLVTVGVGVAAAAAAPVLNARRLRTMNIPDTLRFVE
jgi:putative ABC transport system permease protein